MKKPLLLALDLGTSFIKTGVYDADGTCVAVASTPVKDYRPQAGTFIQKGEDLFASVLQCLKDVAGKLGDNAGLVEAISFTGQMSGFMGVDKNWEDITTWSCSLDSRYMPYANRQMETLKDAFLRVAGTNFPQMAPKIEWFRSEYPDEAKRVAKYLMISGYVIGRLGQLDIEDAVIDRSYTGWTGLVDVNQECWAQDICTEVGVKEDVLPRIVPSNYVCGRLAPDMAAEVGLPAGIPLVSGAGDKSAGALGAGAVEPGDMIFEASSYGEISCCVEEYRPDMTERRLDVLLSAVPGAFYATHFTAGSGITLDWFINSFVRREGEALNDAFARMEEKIDGLPIGCDGLMAIALLGGSSMPPDGALKGMWMGFDWSHGPEHFYRSLLESITFDLALAMERIVALYPEHASPEVRIVGGGANSPAWIQMNADVTGKTYTTLSRKDCSMWGAAMLAGNAIGLYPDIRQTAKRYVKTVEKYIPRAEQGEAYHPHMALYRDYLVAQSDFYKRIAALRR